MTDREETRRGEPALDAEPHAEPAPRRVITYCIVPEELADKLHDVLREHFREERNVEVVVERRWRDRRAGPDRRAAKREPKGAERRRIIADTGRRVADRRVPVAQAEPPPLPRRARRHADELRFIARAEPAAEDLEDRDTARLIVRFQEGDRDVYSTLYTRYYDRVYGYARLVLSDHHEAEDITQQVFVKLLESLPTYERRAQPFRAWLFIAVRNAAISHLRKTGRIAPEDPQDLANHLDEAGGEEGSEPDEEVYEELSALGWITDKDLLVFAERLPHPQRQVITMRFVLDLPATEVAQIMERTPDDIRKLQHRALNFLRDRLTAIGRAPSEGNRPMGWQRRPTQVKVLRDRRFILMK